MKDKLILLVWLLMGTSANAQEPSCKNVNAIAQMESRAYARRVNAGNVASLTMASGNYTVNYYRCEWNIDPAVYFISGKVTAYFTVTRATNNIVLDLSSALTVDSIRMRKNKLVFSQSSSQTLTVQLTRTYKRGKRDSIVIYYKGTPVGSG